MVGSRGTRRLLLCAAGALASAGACRNGDPTSSDEWNTAIETRAEHEEHFPLEALFQDETPSEGGAAHFDVDCADCHDGGSFLEYTCTNCHAYVERNGLAEDPHGQTLMDAEHLGKQDYAFDDVLCLDCHPDGSRAGGITVDNHPDFPFEEQLKHRRFAVPNLWAPECELCHTNGEYEVVACRDCHWTGGAPTFPPAIDNEIIQPGGDHAGMEDFCQFRDTGAAGCDNVTVYSVDSCYDCHPGDGPEIRPIAPDTGDPMSIYEHDRQAYRLDIRGGVPGNATNCATLNGCNHNLCGSCHNVLRPDRDYGAIDFTQYSCDGACHNTTFRHTPENTDPAFYGTATCGINTGCDTHYGRGFTTPCNPTDIPSELLVCFSNEPRFCVGCHQDLR